MKANVYVDAFNLYYRALRYTSNKWLNIRALCELALPHYEIQRIRYCTALIQPRADSPRQGIRQQTYIRALSTVPGVSVHYGTYKTNPTRLPLVRPLDNGQVIVEVLKTEEKGSDGLCLNSHACPKSRRLAQKV